MTYIEIELVDATPKDVFEATKTLNRIAVDNLDGEASGGFRSIQGKIILERGRWGTERPHAADLVALHAEHPFTVLLTEVDAIHTNGQVAALRNYWRGVYEAGNLVQRFRPAPISWVEA